MVKIELSDTQTEEAVAALAFYIETHPDLPTLPAARAALNLLRTEGERQATVWVSA